MEIQSHKIYKRNLAFSKALASFQLDLYSAFLLKWYNFLVKPNVAFHFVFEKLSVCLLDLRVYFSLENCQVQYRGEKCLKPLFNLYFVSHPKSMIHSKMSSCAISPLHADGLECLEAASLLVILKKKSPRGSDSQAVMMAWVLCRQDCNLPLSRLILHRTDLEKTYPSTAWLSQAQST